MNTWVQTIGIIIAAMWGVYTFMFTQVLTPRSAPVNITLNLELKKIDGGATKSNLMAVEMKVSAMNPSSREIHLLPSAWIAYGIPVGAEQNNSFDESVINVLAQPKNTLTVQRHVTLRKGSVIAAGHISADTTLKPNEHIARTILFYLPRQGYDELEVRAFMPCVADTTHVALEWKFDDGDCEPHLYRIDKHGANVPVVTDEQRDCLTKQFDLQTAQATVEISLWQ